MNGNIIIGIRLALLVLAIFLGYRIYRVIMEPIEYQKIEERRYSEVIDRLEQIRDAQKLYRTINGEYIADLDVLIGFIDTGRVDIIERKDSSFMAYDAVYQQDMLRDTIVKRVIGNEAVRDRLFGSDYDAERLRYVPFSDNKEFSLDASTLVKNGVNVPVFEAAASNRDIFQDLIAKDEYTYFIDEDYALIVGSLSEPSVSGNWK